MDQASGQALLITPWVSLAEQSYAGLPYYHL